MEKKKFDFGSALGVAAAVGLCLNAACQVPGGLPAAAGAGSTVTSETTQDFVPPPVVAAPSPAPVPAPSATPAEDPYAVLKARLARAATALKAWDQAERARMGSPSSDDGSLWLLPVDAFSPITPWYPESRAHEYGRKSMNFDARRAAEFVALMRPEVPAIHAGDLSDSDGSTPSDANGLRHPVGAHVDGYSADLSYAGMPEGQHTLDQLDVEAAAWEMYSILESHDVVSVITAYKVALVARAEDWYAHGVIGFEAITRFRDDLWLDTTLNHDGHLHINTSDAAGLLLSPGESMYGCYAAQTGAWGTAWWKTCS